ncbi:hypothetical protein BX265_6512 [Streptomyces sp. TLI_235]|nr:hypothetical protein BX265_6512 [Streptomyces sp. TLI_235]
MTETLLTLPDGRTLRPYDTGPSDAALARLRDLAPR